MEKNALIGFSGFVGSTLLKQTRFTALYRSNNINEIENQEFDMVVCAGAPGQKWLANREPEKDCENIDSLINHLKTVNCKTFVLISTVDVFHSPYGVDESTAVDESHLQPYGLNRRTLEKFVELNFERHLIIRLPGLVGPGLRKNVIFDFLNGNNLETVESRSIYQFYPMVNLWHDIQHAIEEKLSLLHLTAEPISVASVSIEGFGKPFTQTQTGQPVSYDMRTKYAQLFGATGNYQYSTRETVQAIRAYAQSEPVTITDQNGESV